MEMKQLDEFGKILLEALDETFLQLSFSVRPAVCCVE